MHSIRIRSTSPLVDADFMNIDETDFAAMSRPEQIRHFEVEGYLVLPSILTPDVIGRLKKELAHAEMSHTSYSTQQTRSVEQPQWLSRTAAELIGYPPVIDFLTDLMGPDIVFTRGFFRDRCPGVPASRCTRMVNHTARTCSATRGVARGWCEFFITWTR